MQNMINTQKLFFILLLFLVTISINSQGIFGKWNSKNDDTGEIDSVIEVYKKNGKAYAKVIEIKDLKRQNSICTECEGKNKNKKILGLEILTGLQEEDNEWSGGRILDPRNGKIYKCYIQLIKPNKLKIRGYIGFSLFGKTAYWEKVK